MKSSDSLHCYDSAFGNHSSCFCDCIRAFHAYRSIRSFYQINFWPALITTDRLCIVSSACRIVILLLTFRTHRKFFHTCTLSVIRKSIQNRKSWTTAGTVNKWMQISPILWIIQFFLTFLTDCNIRRNKDFSFCLLTFYDGKVRIFFLCIQYFFINFEDCSAFRRTGTDFLNKQIHCHLASLCEDFHIRSAVTNASSDLTGICMSADGWTESYALYNSIDTDFLRYLLLHRLFLPL